MWKKYNNEDIYKHYIGEYPVEGFKYSSPFRNDGLKPSLSFFYAPNGELLWTDFGGLELNDDIKSRDGIGFVMQKEGLSYIEAENYIDTFINSNSEVVHNKKVKVDPIIRIRNYWKDFEIEYWKNIDKSLIVRNEVYPLEAYGFSEDKLVTSLKESPAFFYMLDKNKKSWKIYRPFEGINKWKSNKIGKVIEGYDLLPNHRFDNLIVTSSKKDSLTCMTHIENVWAINPPSENIWNFFLSKAVELNSRARNVFIWLDSDRTGVMNSKKIAKVTGWKIIYNEYNNEYKDQFDILEKVGGYAVKQIKI